MSADIVERLNGLIAADPQRWTKIRETAADAKAEIERWRAECEEQARLNGMGAERELALRAKVERLQADNAKLLVLLRRASNFISANGYPEDSALLSDVCTAIATSEGGRQ